MDFNDKIHYLLRMEIVFIIIKIVSYTEIDRRNGTMMFNTDNKILLDLNNLFVHSDEIKLIKIECTMNYINSLDFNGPLSSLFLVSYVLNNYFSFQVLSR